MLVQVPLGGGYPNVGRTTKVGVDAVLTIESLVIRLDVFPAEILENRRWLDDQHAIQVGLFNLHHMLLRQTAVSGSAVPGTETERNRPPELSILYETGRPEAIAMVTVSWTAYPRW